MTIHRNEYQDYIIIYNSSPTNFPHCNKIISLTQKGVARIKLTLQWCITLMYTLTIYQLQFITHHSIEHVERPTRGSIIKIMHILNENVRRKMSHQSFLANKKLEGGASSTYIMYLDLQLFLR